MSCNGSTAPLIGTCCEASYVCRKAALRQARWVFPTVVTGNDGTNLGLEQRLFYTRMRIYHEVEGSVREATYVIDPYENKLTVENCRDDADWDTKFSIFIDKTTDTYERTTNEITMDRTEITDTATDDNTSSTAILELSGEVPDFDREAVDDLPVSDQEDWTYVVYNLNDGVLTFNTAGSLIFLLQGDTYRRCIGSMASTIEIVVKPVFLNDLIASITEKNFFCTVINGGYSDFAPSLLTYPIAPFVIYPEPRNPMLIGDFCSPTYERATRNIVRWFLQQTKVNIRTSGGLCLVDDIEWAGLGDNKTAVALQSGFPSRSVPHESYFSTTGYEFTGEQRPQFYKYPTEPGVNSARGAHRRSAYSNAAKVQNWGDECFCYTPNGPDNPPDFC